VDIHQLRVFASVFRNKSFSKASEELHLTQPTISNHIKSLEDEFDCKLFDRLGRTNIPTKEAEVLYSHSMELIEKADTIKEAIGEIRKDVTGKLVVGASTIPGVYLLPRIMSEFQKRYPSISFQILISDSSGIVDSVSKHELLLGFVGAKLGNEQINYIPFVQDKLIVVSSPNLEKNSRMTLKELVKLPMVLREEGSGTRRETEKLLESKGFSLEDLKISGIFGSTDAVKQAVKAGLGVSILSNFSVIDELDHEILKEIKLTDIEMKRRFYIVTHKKRTLPRLYDTFLKHIITESKNL
jgi:DNA-binding transcriptional LysR family regulator